MRDYASSTINRYTEVIEVCYVRTTLGLACHNCKYLGKNCDRYKNKYGVTPGEMKKKELKDYGNTEQEE